MPGREASCWAAGEFRDRVRARMRCVDRMGCVGLVVLRAERVEATARPVLPVAPVMRMVGWVMVP